MAWYPQLSFSPMVTVSRKSVVEDRSVNTAFLIHEPTPTTHRFRRRLLADIVTKSFRDDERKFFEPLMRFARSDVRDHIVSSKIDHGPP
jgi:hypothetical protein